LNLHPAVNYRCIKHRVIKGLMTGLTCLLLVTCANLSKAPQAPDQDISAMHIFLLAGQSNMAGRGEVSDIDRRPHPGIFVLNQDDKWVPATEPLHFDKPHIAGTGPGFAFARAVAERNPGITIGLVPAAVGGSGIDTWVPGGLHEKTGLHPWDDAARRLEIALQSGELKAVPEKSIHYEARLLDLVTRMRELAGNSELPFLIGQLGQFKEWSEGRHRVNAAHVSIAANDPHTLFVPSDDLRDKGDGTHFDGVSARELGLRYARAYADLEQGVTANHD
jgi:hypothetical protein